MATGHALAHGSGKIPFEVGEMRAGNVVFLIDAGATLPGGERLESITEQGIRFSFSQDGNTQGFERKLYAPLP